MEEQNQAGLHNMHIDTNKSTVRQLNMDNTKRRIWLPYIWWLSFGKLRNSLIFISS